ncbi:MAG: hypothetical protein Phyf2KO_05770 [Phycisphaerales bacterium]
MTHTTRTTRNTRCFTIVELLVTILIIFVVMGVALVSYRAATKNAQSVADRALVNGLKISVQDFSREFGFVPPLVKDTGGEMDTSIVVVDSLPLPAVYSPVIGDDMDILRGVDDEYPRYSLYSLPYYLIGALDAPVDGVDGPGFVEVRRAGNFAPVVAPDTVPGRTGAPVEVARRGPKRYEPLFDTDRGGVELYIDTENKITLSGGSGTISRTRLVYRTELRDRSGVPIRYYRWYADDIDPATVQGGLNSYMDDAVDFDEQVSGLIAYLNVPRLVLEAYGNPLSSEFEIPQDLRSATYAIVAAGPNKLFGDADEADLLASDPDMQRQYAENLGLSVTRLASDAGYRDDAVEMAREDNIVEVGS